MLQDLGYTVRYEQSYSRFEHIENNEYSENSVVYDEILYTDNDVAAVMNMAIPARTWSGPEITRPRQTPCAKTARCEDCSIVEKSYPKGRVKVVLINEDLGL